MNKTSVIPSDYANSQIGTRVYCLYRISTSQQVDHNEKDQADIPMQRLECHRFAERVGWTIIHEEQEEGVSGHKVRAANRDMPSRESLIFSLFSCLTASEGSRMKLLLL